MSTRDTHPSWRFRYAPQLGYRSPEAPLFRHSAPLEPSAQAARAAELGFAGVQYPWASQRPRDERAALAEILKAHKLDTGCVVWAPREMLSAPYWVRTDASARMILRDHLRTAIEAAAEVGSSVIAVLGGADNAGSSIEAQRRAMADNLRWAGDLATSRNMRIGVEPMVALPGMALRSIEDGLDVLARADHPAVQLIFDTGHVRDLEADVVKALETAFDSICLVQFADQPGRVEPGAGTIDFVAVMQVLAQRGYRSLIELEHGWLSETTAGEAEGLDRLRALERKALS